MKPATYRSIILILFTVFSNRSFSQTLVPLEIGNQWVYEQITIASGSVVSTDTITNEIKGSVVLNGKKWFIINEFGDDFMIRNTRKGQLELDTFNTNNKGKYVEVLIFRKPKRKESQEYMVFETNQVKIDKESQTITTSIKDFECYRYQITTLDSNGDQIETFIAPSIGIIYQNWVNGNQQIQSRLIDYRIN